MHKTGGGSNFIVESLKAVFIFAIDPYIYLFQKAVMDKLSKLEKERNISLPEIYKTFYKAYSSSMPKNLVGSDLFNNRSDLNDEAVELLKEDGVENFLSDKDFVFMMHQGYIFWYFKADGNPDPVVFGYHEGRLKPDNLGALSKFIEKSNTQD